MRRREFHLLTDPQKEEAFLNAKAREGMAMTRFFLGIYTFEDCEPGAWVYRIELLGGDAAGQADYLAFLRESGIECVQRWCDWVYLRRPASEGAFELYSDNASRARYLRRLARLYATLLALNVSVFVLNLAIFTLSPTHSAENLIAGLITLPASGLLLRMWTVMRARATRAEAAQKLSE